MSDDDPSEASPWERDDWMPESAVGDHDTFARSRRLAAPGQRSSRGVGLEPPPEQFADDSDTPAGRRRPIGTALVGGAVVVALVAGSAGALLRGGDDSDATGSPAPSTEPDPPVETISAIGDPTTSIPETTVAGSSPDGQPGGISSVAAGEVPVWAADMIDVPEPLRSIAPTEVITLSQDVVSVTEFPSGRTRSLDVSGLGDGRQLAVGDGAIAVFNSATILQLRDGEPAVISEVPDGVIFVESWTGTGQFIVTTPSTGPSTPEEEFVLQPDGTLVAFDRRLDDEVRFWSRSFSPSGDLLVTRPGGVYAITPVGEPRRISTGDLLAIGDAHWAIEECDETLRCDYSIVAWDDGEVTPGVLDAIVSFGFIDPATRISPDGRSIVYRSDTDGSGQRRILDTATGATVEAGRINQLAYPDAWATDSSGVFITDRFVEFVERETGRRTPIEALGRTRMVATGPFTDPP